MSDLLLQCVPMGSSMLMSSESSSILRTVCTMPKSWTCETNHLPDCICPGTLALSAVTQICLMIRTPKFSFSKETEHARVLVEKTIEDGKYRTV